MDYSRETEILKSLGFEEYDEKNIDHWDGQINICDDDLLFIEKEFTRNRIYVRLSESCNDDVFYQVYVLKNIGCGSIEMPFRWYYLDADFLTKLKMSLSGHGFKTK